MTAAVSTAWMAAEGLELRDLETAAAAAASRAALEGREVLGLERLEVRDRREVATEVVLEVASDSAVVQEGLVRLEVLVEVRGRLKDSRGHHRQPTSWGSSDLEARQADWRDQETEQGM